MGNWRIVHGHIPTAIETFRKVRLDARVFEIRGASSGSKVSNEGVFSCKPSVEAFLTRAESVRFYWRIWRRGWDSNPRATYAAAGFQDRCFQPLSHPSNL